ncbi:hypothetical protein MUP37_06700 [Candidatus Bathyarchaeota archaeon]|nr:hypothetical protein [Candidatus Bathyarchaeota archaeon]
MSSSSFSDKDKSKEEPSRLITTHVRVLRDDHKKLGSIKSGSGFKNLAWVVHSLLEEKARNIATVDDVMDGNIPVVLTGKPLSGKTFFIRQKLLPSLVGDPVLLIDSWDEYGELRSIGYDIYGLDFRGFNEHVRFVPNAQSMVAETEIGTIFAHLDMKRNEMSKWTIIVEEAHTYRNVSSFMKFLYGSRHVVRKMIAVTPQTDAFQGLETLIICR